jgi:hypothetical protein
MWLFVKDFVQRFLFSVCKTRTSLFQTTKHVNKQSHCVDRQFIMLQLLREVSMLDGKD